MSVTCRAHCTTSDPEIKNLVPFSDFSRLLLLIIETGRKTFVTPFDKLEFLIFVFYRNENSLDVKEDKIPLFSF